jgi:hypothetical protein
MTSASTASDIANKNTVENDEVDEVQKKKNKEQCGNSGRQLPISAFAGYGTVNRTPPLQPGKRRNP